MEYFSNGMDTDPIRNHAMRVPILIFVPITRHAHPGKDGLAAHAGGYRHYSQLFTRRSPCMCLRTSRPPAPFDTFLVLLVTASGFSWFSIFQACSLLVYICLMIASREFFYPQEKVKLELCQHKLRTLILYVPTRCVDLS